MHLIGYKAYVAKYPLPEDSNQSATIKESINTDSKIDGTISKLREKIDESRDMATELNNHKHLIEKLSLEIEHLKNEKNDRMREEEKKKAEEIMNLNVNMKEKIELLKQQ